MPKNTATLTITSDPGPDGRYTIGDTVTFDITPDDGGVISYACETAQGEVVLGGGLIRGDTDFVVSYSPKWQANPVPLSCTASLIELRKGRTVVFDTVEFDLVP